MLLRYTHAGVQKNRGEGFQEVKNCHCVLCIRPRLPSKKLSILSNLRPKLKESPLKHLESARFFFFLAKFALYVRVRYRWIDSLTTDKNRNCRRLRVSAVGAIFFQRPHTHSVPRSVRVCVRTCCSSSSSFSFSSSELGGTFDEDGTDTSPQGRSRSPAGKEEKKIKSDSALYGNGGILQDPNSAPFPVLCSYVYKEGEISNPSKLIAEREQHCRPTPRIFRGPGKCKRRARLYSNFGRRVRNGFLMGLASQRG